MMENEVKAILPGPCNCNLRPNDGNHASVILLGAEQLSYGTIAKLPVGSGTSSK